MNRRMTTPERVRRAHDDRIDPERADRVMSREFRSPLSRRERRDAPAVVPERPARDPRDTGETPALLAARMDRERVTPHALRVACPEHGAAVGVPCFATVRAVCGARIRARSAADR